VAVEIGAACERAAEEPVLHLSLVRGDELLTWRFRSEERDGERRGDDSSGHRSSSVTRAPASQHPRTEAGKIVPNSRPGERSRYFRADFTTTPPFITHATRSSTVTSPSGPPST